MLNPPQKNKSIKMEQKVNSSTNVEHSTETAILPMQCYVQPIWKHSDIEIYNESNLDTMSRMPNNCIDLTVTSPPYDDLRNYRDWETDRKSTRLNSSHSRASRMPSSA